MGNDVLRGGAARILCVAALVTSGSLPGCRAKLGDDCTRAECDEGLSCYAWVCRPKAEVERIRADLERAKSCKASCVWDGMCGAKDGRCIANDDADCRKSKLCELKGACSAKDGACVALSDEDCKRRTDFARDGKGHASNGACILAPGACRVRSGCQEYGLCTERGDACIAGADADCLGSDWCRGFAECTARDGKCVIGSDEDCARSRKCSHFAMCKQGAVPGECVLDAKSFAESEACRRYGCCGKGEISRCRARSNEDCKKSTACEKDGRCFMRMGACVRDCKDTEECRDEGLCTDGPGATCIAGSDADCASSWWCRRDGKCTAKRGKCVGTPAAQPRPAPSAAQPQRRGAGDRSSAACRTADVHALLGALKRAPAPSARSASIRAAPVGLRPPPEPTGCIITLAAQR